MTYIKLFIDYLEAIEPLGDAERGRLFTALLQYAKTGEAPQLSGSERFVFPMMRMQVDRDTASFCDESNRISESRREAGRKGGLASAEKRSKNEAKTKQNLSKTKQTQANQANEAKDKDKDKDEDKDEEGGTPLTPLCFGSTKMNAVVSEWLAYKAERRESYKPTGLKALETQIKNNVATYGEAAVVDLIRECMANGWRGIIWDRLRERKGGGQRGNGFNTSNPFLEMLEEERGR